MYYFPTNGSSCSFTYLKVHFLRQICSQVMFLLFSNDGSNCNKKNLELIRDFYIYNDSQSTHKILERSFFVFAIVKNLCTCQSDLQWLFKAYVDIISCQPWCIACSNWSEEICKWIISEVNAKLSFLSCFIYIFRIDPKLSHITYFI